MLNKTPSRIIIEMKDIDRARLLTSCLDRIRTIAGYGGSLVIKCNGEKFEIGGDVVIGKVTHVIEDVEC